MGNFPIYLIDEVYSMIAFKVSMFYNTTNSVTLNYTEGNHVIALLCAIWYFYYEVIYRQI